MGKAPNKYCKTVECVQVGIEAGHIQPHGSKRVRVSSPTNSEATQELASTDDISLVEIDRIYGCRCRAVPPFPTSLALCPACLHFF